MSTVKHLDVAINNITKAAGWETPAMFNFKYGDNYEGEYPDCLEWLDEREKPFTDEEIIAECAAVVAAREAVVYKKEREAAYPSIGDQLDMIFHAGLGGDEFQAAIQAVKDAYPKP